MLEFVITQITYSYEQPPDKFNTFAIITIKSLLGEGLRNFKILFLKITKLFELRRVGSNLFHLMIVEGKKEPLKKFCLILKQRMLSTFLVVYA